MASTGGRALPVVTDAERTVADLLPIEADPAAARRALERVPLWFHTFALNRVHGLYTPGVARDHRYRVSFLPPSFAGGGARRWHVRRLLRVSRRAPRRRARGRRRQRAVRGVGAGALGDRASGGEGFATIAELLGSRVQYRRGDALALDGPAERFDVVLCYGILHRVENPLGLLRRLAALLAPGGRLLVETYGIASDGRLDAHTIEVQQPGGVYAGDEYVYWGFGAGGWRRSPSWPA